MSGWVRVFGDQDSRARRKLYRLTASLKEVDHFLATAPHNDRQ
jgi:hypothetical protein